MCERRSLPLATAMDADASATIRASCSGHPTCPYTRRWNWPDSPNHDTTVESGMKIVGSMTGLGEEPPVVLRLNGIATQITEGLAGEGFIRDPMGGWRPLIDDGLHASEDECVRLHDDLAR